MHKITDIFLLLKANHSNSTTTDQATFISSSTASALMASSVLFKRIHKVVVFWCFTTKSKDSDVEFRLHYPALIPSRNRPQASTIPFQDSGVSPARKKSFAVAPTFSRPHRITFLHCDENSDIPTNKRTTNSLYMRHDVSSYLQTVDTRKVHLLLLPSRHCRR